MWTRYLCMAKTYPVILRIQNGNILDYTNSLDSYASNKKTAGFFSHMEQISCYSYNFYEKYFSLMISTGISSPVQSLKEAAP